MKSDHLTCSKWSEYPFLPLWFSSIWNTVPLSLLRFLTSLVCSCVQTALAEGKRLLFIFFKWLFHNLLAQTCCRHALCFSGSLGPAAISMCLASHLNDPGEWLPWKASLNMKRIFFPALWDEACSGILSRRGEGLAGLDCSWTEQPGVFWFSLKFSGCLSGLLRWLWVCSRAGCAILSATHTHQISAAPRMRENCRWETGWLKGSCSAVFVIRDPIYNGRTWPLLYWWGGRQR